MNTVDYRDFQPAETSRVRENVEWSISYAFNAKDTASPRVLLIGDSICNGYQSKVREKLAGRANVSFWASSKCVTDPDYFRELDFVLDGGRFDLITFNNGLHSLGTDRAEWEAAYRAVIAFIRAKKPDAALTLVLCTPLNDPPRDEASRELNDITRRIAADTDAVLLDLYAPLENLNRDEHMNDVYHWKAPAIEIQAEVIRAHVESRLAMTGDVEQTSSETGPNGAIR